MNDSTFPMDETWQAIAAYEHFFGAVGATFLTALALIFLCQLVLLALHFFEMSRRSDTVLRWKLSIDDPVTTPVRAARGRFFRAISRPHSIRP